MAENSWHRYDMKKLRHCHPMYIIAIIQDCMVKGSSWSGDGAWKCNWSEKLAESRRPCCVLCAVDNHSRCAAQWRLLVDYTARSDAVCHALIGGLHDWQIYGPSLVFIVCTPR